MPSRRWQISATAGAFSSVSWNAGCAATARSMNSRTAALRPAPASSAPGAVRAPPAAAPGRSSRPRRAAARGWTPVPSRAAPRAATAFGEFGAGLQQVLAVVEDQQHMPVARRISTSASTTGLPRLLLDAEHRGDRLRHQPRVVRAPPTRRTTRRPDIRPARRRASCSDSRVLPMPPTPSSVSSRVLREQLRDLAQLALAADERASPAAAGCWASPPASAAQESPAAAPDAPPGRRAPGSRGRAGAPRPGRATRRRRQTVGAPAPRPPATRSTWPPCAAPMMRAARLTAPPKKSLSRRSTTPACIPQRTCSAMPPVACRIGERVLQLDRRMRRRRADPRTPRTCRRRSSSRRCRGCPRRPRGRARRGAPAPAHPLGTAAPKAGCCPRCR